MLVTSMSILREQGQGVEKLCPIAAMLTPSDSVWHQVSGAIDIDIVVNGEWQRTGTSKEMVEARMTVSPLQNSWE
jgi:2-keto-4-pentenoate hydratase/2-oxohepta-3-ene-1,7-dioic acid hydratase in catechol pathway